MSNVSKLSREDTNIRSERADASTMAEQHKHLPINVQNSDEGVLFSGSLQRPVDPGYDAVEQVGVHLLGQSVSGIDRPLLRLRLHHGLGR